MMSAFVIVILNLRIVWQKKIAKIGIKPTLAIILAPQKEFESPTFRLGGGRSILLSYWGISLYILPKNRLPVKKIHR